MATKPTYQEHNGFRVAVSFSAEKFQSAESYVPDDNEIIVVTYPKCGTTWVQQIVLLILRRGHPPDSPGEYFKALPFLEMDGSDAVKQMSRPGCVKTHLPFNRTNFSQRAKYIYVARHPADCVLSFYHHTRFFPVYFFSNGTFDDYFDLFIKGEVDFNDYFDNLLSWYERRHEPNVFFTTYEDIKSDTRGKILDIAKFLGEDHYQALMDNGGVVLENIMKYSSVQYMKTTVNKYWKDRFTVKREDLPNNDFGKVLAEAMDKGHHCVGDFVRKGSVGEGTVVLSKIQMGKLERRIQEKTSHSDVMNIWGPRTNLI